MQKIVLLIFILAMQIHVSSKITASFFPTWSHLAVFDLLKVSLQQKTIFVYFLATGSRQNADSDDINSKIDPKFYHCTGLQ